LPANPSSGKLKNNRKKTVYRTVNGNRALFHTSKAAQNDKGYYYLAPLSECQRAA